MRATFIILLPLFVAACSRDAEAPPVSQPPPNETATATAYGDLPPRKPQGALTNAEWNAYFEEVRGLSVKAVEDDEDSVGLLVPSDEHMVLYIFSKPANRAHPCAVKFAFRLDAPPEEPDVALEAHHARSRHDCYPSAGRTVQEVMAGFRDAPS